MADLKQRSVRGGVATLSAQGVKFVLQIGSTMVLARLLSPEDFGLVAMVTAVTGFVSMVNEGGLSMATVQQERITQAQVSTLFWINVALGVGAMVLTAALGPAIAWFYGEARLTAITLVVSATFLLSGLGVQHHALLRRQMRFTVVSGISVFNLAAGIAAAIAAAWLGYGYWSLVVMIAVQALVNTILAWVFSGWRPGLPVRGSGVKPMLKFGGGVVGFTSINYFTRNADNVIIGAALGSSALGLYSKAYGLLMMPIRQLNRPVQNVLLPALSRLQGDAERYRRVYLRAIVSLAYVGMPLIGFLFVVADDLIAIVLGPGWSDAATVFRLLAPAALFGTVNVAPGWLCLSLGKPGVQVRWALISMPITVTAFLVGSFWGIEGVAVGFSATWCVLHILFIAMACHGSPVAFGVLMKRLFGPSFSACAASAVCLIAAGGADLSFTPLGNCVVMALSYGIVYILLVASTSSGRMFLHDLRRDGLRSLIPRPRQDNAAVAS